jgi:hypothetical protein
MTLVQDAIIDVRILEMGPIFNSLDPSPFTERDLDEDAEAYIVGWAHEVDNGGSFRLVVHLPATEAQKARERDLQSAIRNYFAYRAGMLARDLRDLFRIGRQALAIGAAVLTLCVVTAQLLRTLLTVSTLGNILVEGIIIFGWVANWRPAEIFLYDIWSMRRRVKLYRRLAEAKIDLATH